MAKAARVRGIRPNDSLGQNALRVIAVRLEEMLSWRGALNDPAQVQELHDMRIAAKRLRYALEMFDVCFPEVKGCLKELSDIQEDLGTIHDLDVFSEILRGRLRDLDVALEREAIQAMQSEGTDKDDAARLDQILAAQSGDQRRAGLIGLIAQRAMERDRRYASFQERWGGAALEGFAVRVRQATGLVLTVAPNAPAGGRDRQLEPGDTSVPSKSTPT